MMGDDARTLKIASGSLSATVSTMGAELQSLSDADGRPLQWDGDPAVWSGRAPILFPIIGALADGRYRLDGRTYAMPRHGFARHSLFEVVSHRADAASLRFNANAATRAIYPFDFQLDIRITLAEAELSIDATISNRDTRPMPASLGFHPAFRWPLPFGRPRADHAIRFEHDEAAPVRRLDGNGLLMIEPRPTPVTGKVLALRDELFIDDALIFDRLTSRRATYGATDGPRLEVRFDDFPTLGIWTRPGAGFICIEPWQGVADPVGFDGELEDKPGIMAILPGTSRTLAMTIVFHPHVN